MNQSIASGSEKDKENAYESVDEASKSRTRRKSVDNMRPIFSMNFSPKPASPPALSSAKRNHLSQFPSNASIGINGRFYYRLSQTHPALPLPSVVS